MEYLDERVKSSTDFKEDWTKMRELYSRKLWHQLTLLMLECLNKPGFASSVDLKEFDQKLLNPIKQKINPLSLAEILVPISNEMMKEDPEATINYIAENRDKYMSMNDEASILAQSTIGMIRLLVLHDMPGARDIIESTGEILSNIDGVTPVHSRYYRMSSEYYKLVGKHAEYYHEALRFLGCTDLTKLSEEEKRDWAFSIGLAALLGQGVYNFGELISHEVLDSLANDPARSWLVELLRAFNRGDLAAVESLRPQWSGVGDLAAAADTLLAEKARLLALVESLFRRRRPGANASTRVVPFADIAAATRIPLDQVECLLMRALSLNLMKGRIDEVNQTLTLTWLQPRVLDLDQISSMAEKLSEWQKSVAGVRNMVSMDATKLLS